jgi:hypothetical protein
MRKRSALVVGLGLLSICLLGSTVLAQQEPEPAAPAEVDDAPAVPSEEPTGEKKKMPFGLYLAVGYGIVDSDGFDTSVLTDATHYGANEIVFKDMEHGRVAIGWQLPEGKGDFRLIFNGYKEDSYEFDSVGSARALLGGGVNRTCTAEELQTAFDRGLIGGDELNASPGYTISPLGGGCLYGWWDVAIRDGLLVGERTPATWSLLEDDLNGNTEADPGEIRYLDSDSEFYRRYEQFVPDNLQNNLVTWDALYGREFGGRRFSSRWWGGLRFFEYQGTLLAGAWLNPDAPRGGGEEGAAFVDGYTDQTFLNLIQLRQDTSGWGPLGSWEVNFNFYNKGLVFYMRGEAALTFNQLELESGDFYSVIETASGNANPSIAAPIRISTDASKSSWQLGAEVGARFRMRNGLEFEIGYMTAGYTDVALIPTQLSLPLSEGQVVKDDPEATLSALYGTQDFKVNGWHALVGFQF